MSNEKITVDWEVSGQGKMEIDTCDVKGMTPDEIEEWVREGVAIEVHEQGSYHIKLSGMDEALEKLKEAEDDGPDTPGPGVCHTDDGRQEGGGF